MRPIRARRWRRCLPWPEPSPRLASTSFSWDYFVPTAQGPQASIQFDPPSPPPAGSAPPRLSEWAPERWPVADDWRPMIEQFLASPAARALGCFMGERLTSGAVIYPPQPFRALELTPLAEVRLVILGQDPYHAAGQAQGLAFSVPPGVKVPPSLRNIFKEVAREPWPDQDAPNAPRDGSLIRWARQGVLLLNACLTVEEGRPGAHARRGWEVLTDEIVRRVAIKERPVVFLLWGAQAQAKQALIEASEGKTRHLVLTANHPSPLSALRPPRPFLGCRHFDLANAFLRQHGDQPIVW